MCAANKENLLSSTHSGPVEHCDTSPIYICGGKEITGDNAKANFEKCLANDKNALCTTSLNEDAAKRSKGGPYTSPTPKGMSAPVGNDCNIQYWYCIDKIYREQSKYDADTRCQLRDCGSAPTAHAYFLNTGMTTDAGHGRNARTHLNECQYTRNQKIN